MQFEPAVEAMVNKKSSPSAASGPANPRAGAQNGQVRMTLLQAAQEAFAAYNSRDWAKAEQLCRMILGVKPDFFPALNLLGIIAAQSGYTNEAAELFARAVAAEPGNAEAHNNLGNTQKELRQLDAAIASYSRAIELRRDYAEAYSNRGAALQELKRLDDALDSYERAIALRPDYAEAAYNRGATLQELGRLHDAVASYDRAIAIKPDYAEACYNRSLALADLARLDEAMSSCDRAISISRDFAEAHAHRGNLLKELRRLDEALASYDRAIHMKPDLVEAHNNRGVALQELKQLDAAIASYERAIQIKPDNAEAYRHRGNALLELKRLDEAAASYELALKIDPDGIDLLGTLIHTKMKLCDWTDFDENSETLFLKIRNDERASPGFPVLSLTDALDLQRKASEILAKNKIPLNDSLGVIPKRARSGKIRIGYFSADFHNHATAYLMAELFELHDKRRFELIAFSFGPDQRDEMRSRLVKAFDRFIDVRTIDDKEVARRSRELGVDIAVDLKGFTQDNRAAIFSYRAAPIQVNYLGYPGTMGAEYMDYLIADRILIPERSQSGYSEKIAYMPNSYQANDSQRKIADKVFVRTELGLPEAGFVFCCFNNSYKITPQTFCSWIRILDKVPGSVLWLLEDNATAAENLRNEAVKRGMDPQRLIFAKRMKLSEHLARHGVADLFIDTLPCNAHTTASDALWAGLPVLTRMGESFAGRVAASLLTAVGLPELIVETQEEYEAQAVELAVNPVRIGQLRQRLKDNRTKAPLFDTAKFANDIESAYAAMYDRYQADLPPAHFSVETRPGDLS